jgi:hypothetical protein
MQYCQRLKQMDNSASYYESAVYLLLVKNFLELKFICHLMHFHLLDPSIQNYSDFHIAQFIRAKMKKI